MTPAATMIDFVTRQDARLMHCVQRWRAPRWVRLWMIWATRGGDGWLWCAQGVTVLIFGGPPRYVAVATSGVAAALGIAIFLILKKKIGRKRPSALEIHCWATLLPPDQFSFPSGHTITASARQRTHHPLLSWLDDRPPVLCRQHRRLSHRPGHAFSQ